MNEKSLEDLDKYIGHWIINFAYKFRGSSFIDAEREYFVHENTTVYTKDGKYGELYRFLTKNFKGRLYLFDPRGDRRNCARFFQIMNPYTVKPPISINGKIQPIKISRTPMYFKLWNVAMKNRSYCGPVKVEDINKELPIRQDCIHRLGVTDRYSIPKDLLKITQSYDWDYIMKTATKKYPSRGAPDFTETLPPPSFRFPEKSWDPNIKPQPSNIHWGQMKLLLGEIQFLTYLLEKGCGYNMVIYAGAAAGYHIPLLSRMFPNILFILFDPAKFGIRPTPNIIIRKEFFTDDVAKTYDGMNIVFISDIRLQEKDPEKFEEYVQKNNQMMAKWVNTLNPTMSMLKFRIPFTKTGLYRYLAGKIYLQKFAPQTSTETRLWVTGPGKHQISYDVTEYEENMFYFNTEYRNRSFLDKEPIFGVNYDTYGMYVILRRYLRSVGLLSSKDTSDDIRSKISAMMLEIQNILGKDLLTQKFFRWLTL